MSAHFQSSLAALVARDVTVRYADRTVLDGVDLVAEPGRPLGLVGENGSGKSTLLRVLSGSERPEHGVLKVPSDLAYLSQEPAFPPGADVGAVLTAALAPLHEAVRRLEELATRLSEPTVQEEYAALLDWAGTHDVWTAEQRAAEARHALGLDTVEGTRSVGSLSGGQRMRLALAALVARRPTCVLLDEPTNHLDDTAVEFLERFLLALPGVVVVATHDRAFLDNVCRSIVDLDPAHGGVDGRGGNRFSGGYSDYLRVKADARRQWEEAFTAQRREKARLEAAVRTTARAVAPHNRAPRDNDKFIHHAKGEKVARTVSRRVRDGERRIEALERQRVPKPPRTLSFDSPLTGQAGGTVFLRDVEVPGRLRLTRLDVAAGHQLLVTGGNGSGKSTLLRVLAGEVDFRGQLRVAARRVGHLPQEIRFSRGGRTPREIYAAAVGRHGAPVHAPGLAELGLLHPRDIAAPVGRLSVGQQRRLALAMLVASAPDLLLLDEPTNHISLALAEELAEALQRSAGTVVVASHDRWLRRRWSSSELRLG